MDLVQLKKSVLYKELPEIVAKLEGMRRDEKNSVDVTFAQYLKDAKSMSLSAAFEDLGINPAIDTISNLYTTDQANVRWLIPEIFRSAIRLGLRKKAIWGSLIAAEENISQLSIKMPNINMSDAAPKAVGEAETIPFGNISYGQKDISIFKIGRGMKISYETRDYVSINVLSLFLEDFGVKMGHTLDAMMLRTLINGDQLNGSNSAPVIGITTPGTLTYRDLLRIYIRMARLGRTPNTLVGGEAMSLDVWDLPEFKQRESGTTLNNLTLKTPVPKNSDYHIHGVIPDDQVLMVDPSAAIIKFNAKPLLVETEKIVSNQTDAVYATVTTGFGKFMDDASVLLDRSADFSSAGFPAVMDVDALEDIELGH